MTLKRPEKSTGIDEEWNQAIDDYDLWLADLLKEVRRLYESMSYYSSAPYPKETEVRTAIINLIERVDHES